MCLLFACAIASAASAQTSIVQAPGTDAGRSGPQKPIPEPPQTVVLSVALSAGSAEDATSTQTADGRPVTPLQTDADALMAYQLHAGRATLGVNTRSVIRYEAAGRALTPIREQGGLELSLA